MKYRPINNELFIFNRKRFTEKMKPNSIAVFNANDLMPKSADQLFPFRQNADMFYLTGVDQEQTALILFPDHPDENFREILFVRKTNEHIAIWEGKKLNQQEATQTSGIESVKWFDDFDSVLHSLIHQAENCYLNLNEHNRFSTDVPYKDLRFANELKNQYPLHKFQRSAPILHDIRSVKSPIEVELMKEAINITGKAFDRVLKFVQPGVMEYEIEAEIVHTYLKNRATGPAYDSIIASGANACVLHYVDNNQVCNDGDLLLMDFGADYANYAADLSRTIPVNGRFSDRQKNVYNAVLNVVKEAKTMLRPGTIHDEYHKEVGKIMESELIGLGLLDKHDVSKQNPKKPLYKKYFMHGTSHHLGLDVHDVGNRYQPMRAGNIFTCEPGIYIREENIGVRIENDILLTQGDPIDLMDGIPMEVDEIETIMNAHKTSNIS